MPPTRSRAIDGLRGFAIVLMVAYHFCFDLATLRLLAADFYRDPFWLTARTFILSLFMLLVGISLHLSSRQPGFDRRFWRRLALIAGSALLVSIGSYAMFPRSYIHFGVLHAIAVSLLIARPLAQRPQWAMALGILVVIAGNLYTAPEFDARALNWIGFVTRKPHTEDYVPLFPWLGAVLIGIGLGAMALRQRRRLDSLDARTPRWLAFAGRHSLPIYLLHQPLMIGALLLATR